MSEARRSMGLDLEHLLGRTLAGFRLTHLLGAGTSAVVFRGENALQRALVRSIKVLRPEAAASPSLRAAFLEEAATLARMDHPNVVRCHGVREGQLDDDVFLAMELDYLEGHSLATVLLRSTEAPATRVITRWVLEASLGVAAAHELAIVHRDLRPDNLFLTRDGAIEVLDFGLPRALDAQGAGARLGRAGEAPGMLAYVAPEVCEGGTPTPSSDVYALGITMAELLLGHHPFDPPGEKPRTAPQMVFAHLHEPLPRIAAVRPDVDDALLAVVERATARRTRERFADAGELARALAAIERPHARAPHAAVAVRTELVMPRMRSTFPPPDVRVESNVGARRYLGLAALVLVLAASVGLCARRDARESVHRTADSDVASR